MASAFRVNALELDAFAGELELGVAALDEAVRAASLVAAEGVRTVASANAPRLTGRLASSLTVRGTSQGAVVVSDLIYAGVQERGWPGHNIAPQPYLQPALASEATHIEEAYMVAVETALAPAFH